MNAFWHNHPRVTAGIVAVIVTLVFLPATTFDFLTWDDPFYVTQNPLVRDGLSPASVRAALSAFVVANWAPLTILSYQLDATLFGLKPWGFHLTNILLHAIGVGMLFLALQRMTRAAGRSFAAALVFGIHPLRVESVAWISERKDVLSFVFLAFTLLAYEWYARRPNARRYCAVAIAMFASLASKATLVTMPILLVLVDVWPLRRVGLPWSDRQQADAGYDRRWPQCSWRRVLLEKIPLLLTALTVTLVTVKAQGEALSGNLERAFWGERVPNAIYAAAWYAITAVVPWNLCPYYEPVDVARDVPFIAAAAIALVALVVGAIYVSRREPAISWGVSWFLVSLIPLLQLVQTGGHGYADRYTYIPHVGLSVAIVWGVAAFLRSLNSAAWAGPAATLFAVLILTAITEHQLSVWRDEASLWGLAVLRRPESYYIHSQLGGTCYRAGDLKGAEQHLLRALTLSKGSGAVAARLAVVYLEMGELMKSRRCLDHALMTQDLRPLNPETSTVWILDRLTTLQSGYQPLKNTVDRIRQGLVEARAGRFAAALEHFQTAANDDPRSSDACNNAGMACIQLDQLEEARKWFDKAIDNDPWNPDFRVNLAKLLLAQRDFVPAIMHADIATKLSAADPEAVNVRDVAIKILGHVPHGSQFTLPP